MRTRSAPFVVIAIAAVLSVVLLLVLSVVGHADPATAVDAALLGDLRAGGAVLLLRHAVTDRSIADADPTARGGCDQQRPLSQAGRAQAREVGERLAALDVPLREVVHASPFCRTAETAALLAEGYGFGAGAVRETDALLSTTAAQDADAAAALLAAGEALVTAELGGEDVVAMVTHTQNIEGITGVAVEEGDAVVLVRAADGSVTTRGVVPAADW